jgi:transcriptional regulator GlxA family with amidase domain
MKTLRVGIILTPRFTLNAFANFVDVLRLAADEGDGSRPIRCQWYVMSQTGKSIASSCGIEVTPTSDLIDPKQLDHIAVIGGLIRGAPMVDTVVRDYLLRASMAGTCLIGICTGSFLLCRLGLMKAKTCCISWYHYRDFLEEFDDVDPQAGELYVADGDRITSSGGVGAALVAAHIVEHQLGNSLAQKALHIMQIDKARPGATLQPAPPLMQDCNEGAVNRALLLMEQNLSSPLSISQIAARLHMSTRSLQRLFQRHLGHGPLTAYLHLRLRHARWMLYARVPIIDVAIETGFANGAQFGTAFKRTYGYAPSEARRHVAAPINASALVRLEADRRVFEVSHTEAKEVRDQSE